MYERVQLRQHEKYDFFTFTILHEDPFAHIEWPSEVDRREMRGLMYRFPNFIAFVDRT